MCDETKLKAKIAHTPYILIGCSLNQRYCYHYDYWKSNANNSWKTTCYVWAFSVNSSFFNSSVSKVCSCLQNKIRIY